MKIKKQISKKKISLKPKVNGRNLFQTSLFIVIVIVIMFLILEKTLNSVLRLPITHKKVRRFLFLFIYMLESLNTSSFIIKNCWRSEIVTINKIIQYLQ